MPELLINRASRTGGLVFTLLSLETIELLEKENALSVEFLERLRLWVTFVGRCDAIPESTTADLIRLLLLG